MEENKGISRLAALFSRKKRRAANWKKGKDSRRHSRIYVEFPVKLVGSSGLILTGNSVNISFGGALVIFDHIDPSEVDWEQDWSIRLHNRGLDNIPIGFDARVTGRLATGAIGIQYIDASYQDFAGYKEYLLEVCAEDQRELLLEELEEHEGVGEDFMSNFAGLPLGKIVQVIFNVKEKEIEQALEEQKRTRKKLGDILVKRQVISKQQLDACLALFQNIENTVFSHAFFVPLRNKKWVRYFQLAGEAFLFVLTTIMITHSAGLQESGLISLFLVSTALTSRLNGVLANTDAAGRQAADLLTMFLGMLSAYVIVAINISEQNFQDMFGFVLEVTKVENKTTIWNRNFGETGGYLLNNFFVLISVVLLTSMYRGFALLLTMTWNACNWGLALTLMVSQGISASPEHLSEATTVIISIIALTPHLALEAMSYIYGSLSAIGVSKSVLWHDFMSPRFKDDMTRHGKSLAIAVGFLLVGAYCEGFWVNYILSVFGKEPG